MKAVDASKSTALVSPDRRRQNDLANLHGKNGPRAHFVNTYTLSGIDAFYSKAQSGKLPTWECGVSI